MALSFLQKKITFRIKLSSYCHFKMKLNEKYEKLETNYQKFENIFKILSKLEKNDKIGIIIDMESSTKINFTLYLDKYNIYQSISRWYNNQKRNDIFNKLDILFQEYFAFITIIKQEKQNNFIHNMILYITELNNMLTTKLVILKETYNDKSISTKINSYLEGIKS